MWRQGQPSQQARRTARWLGLGTKLEGFLFVQVSDVSSILIARFICIVARMFRVWRAAPPFRLSQKAASSDYRQSLETSSTSLRGWMGFTLLAWGILAAVFSLRCVRTFASLNEDRQCRDSVHHSRFLDDFHNGAAGGAFLVSGPMAHAKKPNSHEAGATHPLTHRASRLP
jgi:hypothetical protein